MNEIFYIFCPNMIPVKNQQWTRLRGTLTRATNMTVSIKSKTIQHNLNVSLKKYVPIQNCFHSYSPLNKNVISLNFI